MPLKTTRFLNERFAFVYISLSSLYQYMFHLRTCTRFFFAQIVLQETLDIRPRVTAYSETFKRCAQDSTGELTESECGKSGRGSVFRGWNQMPFWGNSLRRGQF